MTPADAGAVETTATGSGEADESAVEPQRKGQLMDASPERDPKAWKLTVGRLLSVVALVFCAPIGALFVSIATGSLGIAMGIAGYVLGARRLGLLAIVLCTAAMFVGLLVGPGVVPGAWDRVVDGWFRNMPTERFTED